MRKSLIIPALATLLAVSCGKGGTTPSKNGWSKEMKQEMESLFGEVMPYAEFDSASLYRNVSTDYLAWYGQILYYMYDSNNKNVLTDYDSKLESAGFTYDVELEGYTKTNSKGYELEVYYGFDMSDPTDPGNYLNVYFKHEAITTQEFPTSTVEAFYNAMGLESVNVIPFGYAEGETGGYFTTEITPAIAGYIYIDCWKASEVDFDNYLLALDDASSGWIYDAESKNYYFGNSLAYMQVENYVDYDQSVRIYFGMEEPNKYDGVFDQFPVELVEEWFDEWGEYPTIPEYVSTVENVNFECEDDYNTYYIYVNGSNKEEMLTYIDTLASEEAGWTVISEPNEDGDATLTVIGTYSYVSIVNFEDEGYIGIAFYISDPYIPPVIPTFSELMSDLQTAVAGEWTVDTEGETASIYLNIAEGESLASLAAHYANLLPSYLDVLVEPCEQEDDYGDPMGYASLATADFVPNTGEGYHIQVMVFGEAGNWFVMITVSADVIDFAGLIADLEEAYGEFEVNVDEKYASIYLNFAEGESLLSIATQYASLLPSYLEEVVGACEQEDDWGDPMGYACYVTPDYSEEEGTGSKIQIMVFGEAGDWFVTITVGGIIQ